LLNRGCRYACAFNEPKQPYHPPTRFVREGDVVPMGLKNLGPNGKTGKNVWLLQKLTDFFLISVTGHDPEQKGMVFQRAEEYVQVHQGAA
jgi:hypothetical protein